MNTDFATILKVYRQRERLSQTKLASQLGISRNYVSLIERGVNDNVSWRLGCKILDLCAPLEDKMSNLANKKCVLCNHSRTSHNQDIGNGEMTECAVCGCHWFMTMAQGEIDDLFVDEWDLGIDR